MLVCTSLCSFVSFYLSLTNQVSYENLSYQQSSTLQLALPLLPSTDYPHYQHTLADRGQLHGQPLVTQTGSTEHGIPCRACPDVFTSMEELNYHMEFSHHYVACSHCTVWCPSPAALRGHILREHKPKLEEKEGETSSYGGKQGTSELLGKFAAYECSYCSIIVTDYPSLSLHSKTCPSPSCSMICLTCGDKFPSKPEMRLHLKFMHSHKTFGCKFCDMMFSSSSGLLSHTKAKHKPDPKTLCQICGQAFHNRANLDGHMNMHMGLKPFKCKKCGKCYGHSKSLMTHEKNCSKSLSAVGKGRSQWSRLSSSRDNSFLHRGEHCMQQPSLANKRSCELDIPSSSQPFSFPDQYHSTFVGDKKLENNSSIQASQSSSESYTYNDPSYQSLHSLNMESISTASVLSDSVFDPATSDFVLPQVTRKTAGGATQTQTDYQCISCYQSFTSYRSHLLECPYTPLPNSFPTLETSVPISPYSKFLKTCNTCGEVFHTSSEWLFHVNFKHGVNIYSCNTCNEPFGSSRLLVQHKKSVHGDPIGQRTCPLCGKTFTTTLNLRGHMNMHKGSRPYKCQKCGEAFAYSQSKHRHQKLCTK
ncbi:oocyte zinc finger protein XlCOF6 [Biomphalaria pfeifferi]|uniref:Oocyte zinc finger protein XlCOF6 n=1 Tax=Biomphalaria pfeifferi TaxID=112525 RepID=A0AAD8CC29_BIOPF|nr:oocyte zinc finger protein XlCOF6 [Biomphalaria pfeifferi]